MSLSPRSSICFAVKTCILGYEGQGDAIARLDRNDNTNGLSFKCQLDFLESI